MKVKAFCKEYDKLIAFGDFEELLGQTNKEKFAEWNSEKSREILDNFASKVAVPPNSQISLKNWEALAKIINNAENTYEIDASEKTLSLGQKQLGTRTIDSWSDQKIKELLAPDPREKVWENLATPKEGEGIFDETTLDLAFFLKHKDVLFEDPDDPENTNLKPFWKSLFNLDPKFYKDGKLTATDFESLNNNVKEKLDDGFDEEIGSVSLSSSMFGGGNDYWIMEGDSLKEVHDDVIVKSGKEITERPALFSVNTKLESWHDDAFNENYASVKALVKRLEMLGGMNA